MKKILCFLICLMIMIPCVGALGDDKSIDTINLTFKAPIEGENSDDVKPQAIIPAGSGGNYWIQPKQFQWCTEDGSALPSTTFERDKTYYFKVFAYPHDGYDFAGSVSCSCENAKLVSGPDIDKTTDPHTLTARFSFTPGKIYTVTVLDDVNGTGKAYPEKGITGTNVRLGSDPNIGYKIKEWQVISGNVKIINGFELNIGTEDVVVKPVFEEDLGTVFYMDVKITPPTVGQKASEVKAEDCITVPDGVNYQLASASWLRKEDETFKAFKEGECFEEDNTYVYFVITTINGKMSSRKTQINLTGGSLLDGKYKPTAEAHTMMLVYAKVNYKGEQSEQGEQGGQSEQGGEQDPASDVTSAIELSKTKLTLKNAKEQTVTAELANPDDSIASVKSSKESYAKATFSGNKIIITPGKKAGKSTITVTTKMGASAKLTVTVKEGWSLNEKNITLKKGEKFKIKVSAVPSSVKIKKCESSKPKVAKVDKKGNITAKKKGKATIKVTLSNGKTVKLKVTVK